MAVESNVAVYKGLVEIFEIPEENADVDAKSLVYSNAQNHTILVDAHTSGRYIRCKIGELGLEDYLGPSALSLRGLIFDGEVTRSLPALAAGPMLEGLRSFEDIKPLEESDVIITAKRPLLIGSPQTPLITVETAFDTINDEKTQKAVRTYALSESGTTRIQETYTPRKFRMGQEITGNPATGRTLGVELWTPDSFWEKVYKAAQSAMVLGRIQERQLDMGSPKVDF